MNHGLCKQNVTSGFSPTWPKAVRSNKTYRRLDRQPKMTLPNLPQNSGFQLQPRPMPTDTCLLRWVQICIDEQALTTQLVQWSSTCYKEAIQEGKPVKSHLIPLEERWSLKSEMNMDAYHISTKRWRPETGSSMPQLYRKFRASLGYMRSCLKTKAPKPQTIHKSLWQWISKRLHMPLWLEPTKPFPSWELPRNHTCNRNNGFLGKPL